MFKNRVRLPIFFSKPQFPVEKTTFRKADGSTQVLSAIIRNTFEGKTDQLPEDWHRKLVIALSHDEVTVEGERLLSDVVLSGDYGIDWQEFQNYPIAQALFSVDVTPFNATNTNCQTCEEITQLNLVDDYTDEIWDEGTTHDFPDVLTDNDEICCNPYTIELLYFNTLYFTSVTLSAAGVLTATVINPAPILTDVLIGRYRVTCPNGQYDDADVYGNITGTDVDFCYPPVGPLVYSYVSSTEANISWDVYLPPPLQTVWELYLTADLGTIIQSGVTASSNINITGLTPGEAYTVLVKSDCGGYNYSIPVTLDFSIVARPADICGNFTVTYLPADDTAPQSISYMDCNGAITNFDLTFPQETAFCMLITAGTEEPLYFVASSADISIVYTGLCE